LQDIVVVMKKMMLVEAVAVAVAEKAVDVDVDVGDAYFAAVAVAVNSQVDTVSKYLNWYWWMLVTLFASWVHFAHHFQVHFLEKKEYNTRTTNQTNAIGIVITKTYLVPSPHDFVYGCLVVTHYPIQHPNSFLPHFFVRHSSFQTCSLSLNRYFSVVFHRNYANNDE